tara:strand:- start:2015 stop:2683 length:669 start_codon:yes stop_codon:yes gene_type:complete
VNLKINNKIKPYLVPLVYFILIFSIGAILQIFSKVYLEKPFPNLIFKSFTLLSFLTLISRYKNEKWNIFKINKISKRQLLIILFLFSLFVITNYISITFSNQEDYANYIRENLNSFILIITISSIGEEIIYRGFIQTYINQFFKDNRIISRGNIFASILFWITHLGFFTIMQPSFAIMSLILVAISSIVLGYLKDKNKGIILPIIVHLICNYIHTFMKITLG